MASVQRCAKLLSGDQRSNEMTSLSHGPSVFTLHHQSAVFHLATFSSSSSSSCSSLLSSFLSLLTHLPVFELLSFLGLQSIALAILSPPLPHLQSLLMFDIQSSLSSSFLSFLPHSFSLLSKRRLLSLSFQIFVVHSIFDLHHFFSSFHHLLIPSLLVFTTHSFSPDIHHSFSFPRSSSFFLPS